MLNVISFLNAALSTVNLVKGFFIPNKLTVCAQSFVRKISKKNVSISSKVVSKSKGKSMF